MKFQDIDFIFKDVFPKEVCYELYKYSTDICDICELRQTYCGSCQIYICYCNNKERTLKCHCCKNILCNHHVESVYICGSVKEYWCHDCWRIDDFGRRGEEKKENIDKYNE